MSLPTRPLLDISLKDGERVVYSRTQKHGTAGLEGDGQGVLLPVVYKPLTGSNGYFEPSAFRDPIGDPCRSSDCQENVIRDQTMQFRTTHRGDSYHFDWGKDHMVYSPASSDHDWVAYSERRDGVALPMVATSVRIVGSKKAAFPDWRKEVPAGAIIQVYRGKVGYALIHKQDLDLRYRFEKQNELWALQDRVPTQKPLSVMLFAIASLLACLALVVLISKLGSRSSTT